MKIPKQVSVLGEVYTIEFKDGMFEEGTEGYIEPYEFIIYLDSRLKKNPRILKRVFLHELGHAFALESGLHEILAASALEQFCQAFSGMLSKFGLKL